MEAVMPQVDSLSHDVDSPEFDCLCEKHVCKHELECCKHRNVTAMTSMQQCADGLASNAVHNMRMILSHPASMSPCGGTFSPSVGHPNVAPVKRSITSIVI
eukprot:3351694-Rhodomonas_salina.3